MKHRLTCRLTSILLLLLTLAPAGAAFASDAPVITVKSAPRLMGEGVTQKEATRAVKGKVELGGLRAKDLAVIAFIDNGQWIKPYWDKYLTKISSKGSFSVKLTTGGHDTDIDEFRLFLVKRTDFKDYQGYPSMSEVMAVCLFDSGSLYKSGI